MKTILVKTILVVVLAVAAVAGCGATTSQILARERTYDVREYAPYDGGGSATVTGLARATVRGGDVLPCAEDSIYLFPATRYAEEWWQRTLVEGKYLADPDPRSLAYTRTLLTDAEGRFRFRSLPAGEYFIVGIIRKDDVAGARRGDRGETVAPLQVANLGKRVRVGRGETADVSLDVVSRHRVLIDPPAWSAEPTPGE